MEWIVNKPTRANMPLMGLALLLLFLLAACRQTDAPPADRTTPEATAANPTPLPTAPPPTPEPTPLPLPTAWPTAVYNPDLPDWTILVHTSADRQADWQTAPITGSVQLLISTEENLAAFWADGRQTAPANRYALILQQSAEPPELVEALPPFDLILFDQPQTIRLELLNEWQPYGRIAVGSPAFAAGWITPDRMSRLTSDQSSAEAIAWARWLIADHEEQEDASELAAWRPLTAVNLDQLHEINRQLSNLSLEPSSLLAPIAPPLTMRMDAYNQYDLARWAAMLGETGLVTAVNEAIAYGGLGLQFAFTPPQTAPPPLIAAQAIRSLPLDAGQPAYLLLEWAGVGLTDLVMETGQYDADGRLRLIHREIVPPDGRWTDGVYQFPWLWYPLAPYLSDGETAAHLPVWRLAGGRQAAVGRYLPASGAAADGWLILDPNAPGLTPEIWLLPENPANWQIIIPAEGDRFAAAEWYLTEDELWAAETGASFLLLPEEGLQLTDAPLPPGDYRHRFVGSNVAGSTAVSEIAWQMAAAPRWPNQAIYLDMAAGFQLAYPQNWRPLELVDDGRWQGGSPDQTIQFTITRLADWPGGTLNSLQQNALAAFGAVERLLEESVLVDGRAGLLTAYGYSDEAGPRTGLLLVFINGGLGYLVDVDGPLSAETENVALARQAAASWSFAPPLSLVNGLWQRLETADFAAYYPANYRHQALSNGWHLLREPDAPIFVALRQDESGERSAHETALHWLQVAGRDVDNFAAKEAEQFALDGRLWTRIDFSYTQSSGRSIYGLIMTTLVDGREWSAWIEAPPADFTRLTEGALLFTIASVESD